MTGVQTCALPILDLEEKGIEIIDELPFEVTEALDASTPETKSETTLEDIVKTHHPDFFDFSK